MTGPTYLFLDTEWADEAGTELVSLALVSEDGQRTFYAEREPLPLVATDFVRRTVYPYMDSSPDRNIPHPAPESTAHVYPASD